MHDGEKKNEKRGRQSEENTHMVVGTTILLSSVIGKIRVHQGAFCRDPLGTVVRECLLRETGKKPRSATVRGIER